MDSAKSSESYIEQLKNCTLSPDRLYCAEYCFEVAVNFEARRKDVGVNHLKCILIGLLNTSGGLITIISQNKKAINKKAFDSWKLYIEDLLFGSIPIDVCRRCIQLQDYTNPAIMLVKKSDKLITLESNMYFRWLAGNRLLNDANAIIDVIKQVPRSRRIANPFEGTSALEYGSKLDISEGPNFELKVWKSVKAFEDGDNKNTYRERLIDKRTQRCLFALPNMPDGGYLIIGIEENDAKKTNKVIGQVINDPDKSRLTRFIAEFLLEDDENHPRIWCRLGQKPQQDIDWTIEFIPVSGGPEPREVIVIGFNHFEGGVFLKPPTSFIVNEEGYITEMAHRDWMRNLMSEHHTPHTMGANANNRVSGTSIGSPSYSSTSDDFSPTRLSAHMESGVSKPVDKKRSGALDEAHTSLIDSLEVLVKSSNVNLENPRPDTHSDALHFDTSSTFPTSSASDSLLGSEVSNDDQNWPSSTETMINEKIFSLSTGQMESPSTDETTTEMNDSTMKPSSGTTGHPSKRHQTSTSFGIFPPQKSNQEQLHQSTEDDDAYHDKDEENCAKIVPQLQSLSWTMHRENWQHTIGDSKAILYENIHKFATESTLFALDDPMVLTPSKESIEASQAYLCGVKEAVEHIQGSFGTGSKSLGFAALHWASMMQIEAKPQRPAVQLFDVFTMNENGFVKIWSAVDKYAKISQTERRKCWNYLFTSGRMTKRNMLLSQQRPIKFNFVDSLAVECALYKINSGPVNYKDHMFEDTESSQQSILHFFRPAAEYISNELKICLAQTLLCNETRIKDLLGDEHSIYLTSEQMEIILELGLDKFNFIQGAPGSGKTYLALHLCKKYKCGYICTTETYRKFLEFQDIELPFLIENSNDMLHHIRNNLFRGLRYLIMDDVHNMQLPKATWMQLFEYIANSEQTVLVIFSDSTYQDYQSFDPSVVKQTFFSFCESKNFTPTLKELSVIHRNSRKVTSFIKSQFEDNPKYPQSSQIAATHTEEGDDVEVMCISNILEDTEDNNLVHLVKTLVVPDTAMRNASLSYEPTDVAILVDTHEPIDDVVQIRKLLRKHIGKRTTVHGADQFPVKGYTVDTLANFMGLDRRVCILIMSKEIQESDELTGHSLANPCYRTFVASRAISRAVFIVEGSLTLPLAATFSMNNLPKASLLCHVAKEENILDLCVVTIDGNPAILYIVDGCCELGLVSIAGDPLDLTIHDPEIAAPLRIASSIDNQTLALAGRQSIGEGPWKWSVHSVQGKGIAKLHTYRLDAKPVSLSWTQTNDIVMVISMVSWKIEKERILVKFSQSDGKLLWRHGENVTRLRSPNHVVNNPATGALFVIDVGVPCIRELTPDGRHQREIPETSIRSPRSLCVDDTSNCLFVSKQKDPDVYLMSLDGTESKNVLKSPGIVNRLSLHRGEFMGVATKNGLAVYDVRNLSKLII